MLNWFHVAGKLASERSLMMDLLAICYLPKRVKRDKHIWTVPLHVSEARLWPTGSVLATQYVKFLQSKSQAQFEIITAKDAQLVLDFLPMMT